MESRGYASFAVGSSDSVHRTTRALTYNRDVDTSPHHHPIALNPSLARTTPVDPSPKSARWRNGRHLAALAIAIAADAIQCGLLPLFMEGAAAPWNDALDIGVGAALVALLGWHVVFLPAFLGELVPFLNLFPTWTATVLFVVTRKR